MVETWNNLGDAVLAGENTFACPDQHTHDWVMGQFPDRYFPVLRELIEPIRGDGEVDSFPENFVICSSYTHRSMITRHTRLTTISSIRSTPAIWWIPAMTPTPCIPTAITGTKSAWTWTLTTQGSDRRRLSTTKSPPGITRRAPYFTWSDRRCQGADSPGERVRSLGLLSLFTDRTGGRARAGH